MAIADFIEPAVKDYATQATAAYSAPINTDTFTGRQFVAGQDPMQTQAAALATQGVGSYQPYLQAAQTAQTAGAGALGQSAQTIGGLGALTGPQAYQPFMSPYQSQVIDATLSEFDKSRLAGQQQIRDAAVGSGNFGGGREGALLGQYDADSLANRTGLQAQLLQQGFQNAQAQRAQDLQNQFALSNFQRAGIAGDVGNLGQLGAFRQGLDQSNLQADAQAAQARAYEPFQRLSQYGSGITSLAGGVGGQQFQTPATPSPFSTALSTLKPL